MKRAARLVLLPLILAIVALFPQQAFAGGYVNIYVEASPAGAGSVYVNGGSSYSGYTGDQIWLLASANEGYTFSHWYVDGVTYYSADPTFETDAADQTIYATAYFTHEHVWGEWNTNIPASCIDEGDKWRNCVICGESEWGTIPATGIHSWSEWTEIASPTCGASGTNWRHCTVPGCDAEQYEEIPATGAHTWDAGKQTKEPEVHVPGEWTYTCTVCGATKVEKTPALKASYGIWTFASPTSGGTVTGGGTFVESGDCTITATPAPGYTFSHWQDGLGRFFSEKANYTFTVWEEWHLTAVFTHTHAWDKGKVTKDATYDAAGMRTYTCTICGETKTESIPQLTFNVFTRCSPGDSAWVTGDGDYTKGTQVTVTCSPVDGYTFVRWVRTGDGSTLSTNSTYTFAAASDLDLTAVCEKIHVHTWKEVKAKEPTCTEKGNEAYFICDECGMMVKDTTSLERIISVPEIAMLDHEWDAGKVTKEPTETAEGERTYTCTHCGETKTEAIPKKDKQADPTPAPSPDPTPAPAPGIGVPIPLIVAGAVGLVALGALGAVLVLGKRDEDEDDRPSHMR